MKYGYVIITRKCFRDHIENRSLPRSPLAHDSDGEAMLSGNGTHLPSYRFRKCPPTHAILLTVLDRSVSLKVIVVRSVLLAAHRERFLLPSCVCIA